MNRQKIIPYHSDINYEQWVSHGILALGTWDEMKGKVWDGSGVRHIQITHWMPCPLPPVRQRKPENQRCTCCNKNEYWPCR